MAGNAVPFDAIEPCQPRAGVSVALQIFVNGHNWRRHWRRTAKTLAQSRNKRDGRSWWHAPRAIGAVREISPWVV